MTGTNDFASPESHSVLAAGQEDKTSGLQGSLVDAAGQENNTPGVAGSLSEAAGQENNTPGVAGSLSEAAGREDNTPGGLGSLIGRNDSKATALCADLAGVGQELVGGPDPAMGNIANDHGALSPRLRGSVDARLNCARAKSRKYNRNSSYQCYVDMDGWLKAFPLLTEDDLGPGFSTSCFENSQGLKIATYTWRQCGAPKAAIALFHSYTSYTLFDFLRHQPPVATSEPLKDEEEDWVPKYSGSWIEGFCRLGLNVYAMDHQSHGRSEGWRQWRCNVSKFDCLVNDALQFLKNVVMSDPSLPPDVPIVLLGYSMGGNVVIQTLERIFNDCREPALRSRVNQAVLLAPMIKIKLDFKTEMLLRVNRSFVSCWLPNLRFSRAETSGDCPYLGWWYKKDPFTYSGRTKSRMVAALYEASRRLPKILGKFPPQLKLLCLQGTKDQTVDFNAPLKLYESPVELDLLYLCGWSHYIPKHSGADKLLGLVITWVEKVTLSGKANSHVQLFSLIGDPPEDAKAEASSTC